MAIFLESQPQEVKRRAKSIIENHKVIDRLEEKFDFAIEVELGKHEVQKGKKRPSDAEYASYCTPIFD
eukprot:12009160-Alexandrium_andersonii.AAC.1